MTGIYQDSFAATSLANGKVLVQGGYLEEGNVATADANLYDPSRGIFTSTGKMTTPRYAHTATLLGDGTVLIAGGFGSRSGDPAPFTAEIYDPASGTFSRTGDLTTARGEHAATLLLDGTLLITGGDGVGTAEIYRPIRPVSAPRLFPAPGDTQGQGAIWHANTGEIESPSRAGRDSVHVHNRPGNGWRHAAASGTRRPSCGSSVLRPNAGVSGLLPGEFYGAAESHPNRACVCGLLISAGRVIRSLSRCGDFIFEDSEMRIVSILQFLLFSVMPAQMSAQTLSFFAPLQA